MGKGPVTPIYTYKGLGVLSADASAPQTPFLVSINGDMATVSLFSNLIEDFDIRNNVFVLGLGYPFKIEYGEKIYLETVFDSNGQVAYARIDNEAYWNIFQNSSDSSTDSDDSDDDDDGDKVQIYPCVIANLTTDDLDQYEAYLQDQVTRVTAQQTDHLKFLNDQMQTDQNDPEALAYDQDLLNRTTTAYTNALAKLQDMQNKQNQFFGSLPGGGIVRKEVSCYNVIAYTSQDDSTELNPTTVTPPPADVSDGVTSYSLVQCLFTDLMLNDVFFQFTTCRYPMPCPRPIYFFLDPDNSGNSEDEENTDPDDGDTGDDSDS